MLVKFWKLKTESNLRIFDQTIIDINYKKNNKKNKKQMVEIFADQVQDPIAEDLVLKTSDWGCLGGGVYRCISALADIAHRTAFALSCLPELQH